MQENSVSERWSPKRGAEASKTGATKTGAPKTGSQGRGLLHIWRHQGPQINILYRAPQNLSAALVVRKRFVTSTEGGSRLGCSNFVFETRVVVTKRHINFNSKVKTMSSVWGAYCQESLGAEGAAKSFRSSNMRELRYLLPASACLGFISYFQFSSHSTQTENCHFRTWSFSANWKLYYHFMWPSVYSKYSSEYYSLQ